MTIRFLYLGFILLFQISITRAQSQKSFSKIDQHALHAPDSVMQDLPLLAAYLKEEANDDLEKVRSVYTWISHHIHYDTQAYKNGKKRINSSNVDVLQRRKAVCFGFSTLFQALCEEMDLEVELVSGYGRNTIGPSPRLEEPNHAWNAVKIEGEWFLLDATWESGTLAQNNPKAPTAGDQYFLVDPKTFILTHLPQDPMWQLLDCPISMEEFKTSNHQLKALIKESPTCFAFKDSIRQYRKLPPGKRKIKTAENALRFNPTRALQEELASTYFDQAGILSDQVEDLEGTGQNDKIKSLQNEMIQLIKKAIPLFEVQAWQWELYISTLINQAVIIYNTSSGNKLETNILQAIDYLEEAQGLLHHSTNVYFKNPAENQCQSYLQFLKEAVKN